MLDCSIRPSFIANDLETARSSEMQGVLCIPQNPQQGSPSPNNTLDLNMDVAPSPRIYITKETPSNQSSHSDSGIFSTSNTTLDNTDRLNRTTVSENYDTDNRSDCSSPESRYVCPICNTMLTSQHDFTLHIKSHNNELEVHHDNEKGYTCRICSKVLSSSSSLDRHVLVHSGERPFHCKYCGDTFTTNGNMHRHMRTHSHKAKCYESDASTDSNVSNKSIEFNNNKIESKLNNKRKLEIEEYSNKRPESYYETENQQQTYRCPVCERGDFNSLSILETHVADNHPDYLAKCHQCNQIFQNHKQLENHINISHESTQNKHSVVGFKDLTFVDFSSGKFPHIARFECEKNLHKVSGALKFQCKKCTRAFPCLKSLEYHEKDCSISTEHDNGLDLPVPSKVSNTEVRRSDFFSRLNLQDNSPEKSLPSPKLPESPVKLRHLQVLGSDTKDLADIQSIISMTSSGSLLQQLQAKTSEVTIPNQKSMEIIPESMKHEEEEIQDAFAMEFRKMKLRGEFPCRLCTAIFPNLRALKGHNRAHLNGNNNGTYRCNMCPHSSIDKAALIRHMRTHNGDRPYECSLCNYAFTTKANCERHLRNRHAKTTREEVKKSIIYHPSEDPTNEDLNKITRDESKKNVCPADTEDSSPEKIHGSIPKFSDMRPIIPDLIKPEVKHFVASEMNPLLNNIQALKENFNISLGKKDSTPIFPTMSDVIRSENLKKEYRNMQNGVEPPVSPCFPTAYDFSPKLNNASSPHAVPTKIHVKSLETLNMNSYDSHSDEEYDDQDEEPLDLVLDLSKKKSENDKKTTEDSPEDLSVRSRPSIVAAPELADIFNPHIIKGAPKIDPAAFYQWALFRNSYAALPNWGGIPINPLFLPSLQTPMSPPSPQDMKERLRQLCGGSVISDNRIKTLHQMRNAGIPFNGFKHPRPDTFESNFPISKKPEEISKPLSLHIDQSFNDSMLKIHSPLSQPKSDVMHSPNSVKMVIKNGILMPKQKQRRYRTERPFTCEHCSARFTLRSNMERHIKQQHPQFWSQRQRGNVGNPGRKPQGLPNKSNFCDLSIPNYELPKNEDFAESKESLTEKFKYVLLAQQLKANKCNPHPDIKKEEDEEDTLVIDENDDKQMEAMNCTQERSRSVLEDLRPIDTKFVRNEENQDLVPISRLLDNASQQQFKEFFKRETEEHEIGGVSEEDEEGLVASGSTSEGNISGTDENRSESENATPVKKKSAYSLAPNRVSCPYCSRKFPWTSSLRRHILTHTGQKPFKCSHCPLLFTTKSNCDRHLLRKHGNSATTITNDAINNNTNYLMRNVPERPYKCSNCPSSTFSTRSNLHKHISCKHSTNSQGDDIKAQGYEAGSSEDEKVVTTAVRGDWENHASQNKLIQDIQNVQMSNSDQPFKCHLCEGSFGDRQEALDHIKGKHTSEYNLLMSKNALDSSATTPEEGNHNDEDDNEIRGKFPDYSNRKVICAFCMRRFWSAEDLRRHMRTHTGERPFSCDICRRRFTLKHSMLRHRKKHNVNFDNDNINSDEDGNGNPAGYDNNNSSAKPNEKTDESDCNEGNDLISNLLGIGPSFIDKALTGSADDAAKLLGVRE